MRNRGARAALLAAMATSCATAPTPPRVRRPEPPAAVAAAATSARPPALPPPLQPPITELEPTGPITLAAVGDVMLARTVGDRLSADPPAHPFAAVAPILTSADLAAANLECAIATTGAPAKKAFTFRAPPEATAALVEAGIDVVSLANNHVLDYGPDALYETIARLDAAHVAHAGAGMTEAEAHAPARLHARGKDVAFLAYVKVPIEGMAPGGFDTAAWEAKGDAPGVAWADPPRIAKDVAATKESADVVVVMLHSGFEGESAPNIWQIDAARAAIDAGASVVLGAHPHVLQGAARYKGGFIAYSLGNFVFDGNDVTSAILTLTLGAGDGGVDAAWTPVLVRRGFPELVDEPTGTYVKNVIKALSMPL